MRHPPRLDAPGLDRILYDISMNRVCVQRELHCIDNAGYRQVKARNEEHSHGEGLVVVE